MKKQCRRKHYNTENNQTTRAVIEHQWHESRTANEIHVLIGGDSDKLVNGAGRIYYVVLGACAIQGVSEDDPDVRILRGATEALHDQAQVPEIDETRRLSMISGLQACIRLLSMLERKNIVDAAVDLTGRLKRGVVRYADFTQMVIRP